MGVTFRYIIYCDSPELADRLFQAAEKRVGELNQTLSDYLEASETNQLCRSAPHAAPQPVSSDLYRVLSRSQEFSRLTEGAFDVTVGPASHAWRKAIKRKRLPEKGKLAELLPAIGSEKMELRPDQRVRLLAPDMQLDFGGIAQGDAADQVARLFRDARIAAALIDVSGDIVAIGAPPNTCGWTIEIPNPDEPGKTELLLKDKAISTSGDRAQRLVIDGIRYSHLVDPRTGWAVEQSVQATVIAPDATTADALASALCVLTPEQGLRLVADSPGVQARLLLPEKQKEDPSDHPVSARQSTGFAEFYKSSPGKRD